MTRPTRISPRGQKRLASEEWTGKNGLHADGRFYVYNDYKGFPTIGVGHLVKLGEDWSLGLSAAEVDELFHKDLGDVYAAIARWVRYPVNQAQFDSMCITGHNCGPGFFYPPNCHAIRALNDGDLTGYVEYIRIWNKSAGVYDPHLYARRVQEGVWFLEAPEEEEPANDAPLIQLEQIARDADDAARHDTERSPPPDDVA